MNKKTAFITGVTGQDGALLAKNLIDNGWAVYGGFRRGSSNKTWRLDYLGITSKIHLVEFQLSEPQHLIEILQDVKPEHIYNLAGESFVADSFKYPAVTLEANTHGLLNILDAARLIVPEARIFSASSSEIFGSDNNGKPLNEDSRCNPINPYAISKLAGQYFVNMYRQRYGMFACSGILFNHESPLRGREYVTRKITYNIARIKINGGAPFNLGNLDSARDWGSAEDYVQAMRNILEVDMPEDYIIATGIVTSVRDFLSIACKAAGFEPVFDGKGVEEKCVDNKTGKVIAEVSSKYFRKQDTPPIVGDVSKLLTKTKWNGSRKLEKIISEMVEVDIDRWKKGIINV